ncbi:MAG: hypothetical protein KF736_13375 [Acidobacteria bacterium]|nr:hypothetical protein [Acidobacteriota bacterium]MCW5949705.1 hypothetical protein [Pyrinomonadaceae bacterium]
MMTTTNEILKARSWLSRPAIAAAVFCFFILMSGCAANESILRSGAENRDRPPEAAPPITADKESIDMGTAGLGFVYIVRRQDGAAFDKTDLEQLRELTADGNRRVTAEDGKALVVGSLRPLPVQKLAALRKRFHLEERGDRPATNAQNR